MKCPFCHADDTRVVDSRTSGEGFEIRRRRECAACATRFTTYERIGDAPVSVVKKDLSRIPFDRKKIRDGLEKACYKRPISSDQLDQLVDRVQADVLRMGESEVPSSAIGELVMKELRQLDQVAYVRFASVYREFEDVTDFASEIKPMLPPDA